MDSVKSVLCVLIAIVIYCERMFVTLEHKPKVYA